jgi:hypothetical protein
VQGLKGRHIGGGKGTAMGEHGLTADGNRNPAKAADLRWTGHRWCDGTMLSAVPGARLISRVRNRASWMNGGGARPLQRRPADTAQAW